MTDQGPFIEWIEDGTDIESREDLFRHVLTRVERQWNEGGWDRSFTVGVIFTAEIPGLEMGTLSVAMVRIPEIVLGDPNMYFYPFARLVAQSVFRSVNPDTDEPFIQALLQAGQGSPDQDLDAPREWMRHIVEQCGGHIQGWLLIVEGFKGSLPAGVAGMSDEELRATPGVTENRMTILCTVDRYLLSVNRVRNQGAEEIEKTNVPRSDLDLSLMLLTGSSVKVASELNHEMG